jgi:dTDP-4-amino-4,6-dideoxygalactose transaminase
VPCFSGSCSEIYREKAFLDTGFGPPVTLPVARELGETSVALLVHPTLDAGHMSLAADVVRAVLSEAIL